MIQKSQNIPKQTGKQNHLETREFRKARIVNKSNVTEKSVKKSPEKHPQTLAIRSLVMSFAREMFVMW